MLERRRGRINFLDHGLYISALEHIMKLILCSCVLLVSINRICKYYYTRVICTMYKKCKFLIMGYISALTQASVNVKQECLSVI